MSPGTLPLRPQVFAILAALIEERSGLHYETEDMDLLGDKLSARAIDAGFESLLDYYYYLRYDDASGAELSALIDSLVVNETYFFREMGGLSRMITEVIAPRAESGQRTRVWCAACSTGEEPLSLAMLLADRGLLDRVDLVASDISTRALARAQAGVFGPRSLRLSPPPTLVERWLSERDGRVHIAPEILGAVRFRRINLVDQAEVAAQGKFDLILCRNVLIYFRDATVERMIAILSDALSPGGALLVGVSESLLRFGTSLTCEERGGVFFYRKGSS